MEHQSQHEERDRARGFGTLIGFLGGLLIGFLLGAGSALASPPETSAKLRGQVRGAGLQARDKVVALQGRARETLGQVGERVQAQRDTIAGQEEALDAGQATTAAQD